MRGDNCRLALTGNSDECVSGTIIWLALERKFFSQMIVVLYRQVKIHNTLINYIC